MKTIVAALLGLLLVGCSSLPVSVHSPMKARITWYSNHEDKYGWHTASGAHATEGRTVAAHPNFKFGTKLFIPALKPIIGSSVFIVEDRGSDVTRRKAATHGEYVFDVYINARNKHMSTARIKQLGNLITHAEVYPLKFQLNQREGNTLWDLPRDSIGKTSLTAQAGNEQSRDMRYVNLPSRRQGL